MGMIATFVRISIEQLESFKENSQSLDDLIYAEDFEINNDEFTEIIDIDKSWDGIVFLLTGKGIKKSENEMGSVVLSNQVVDEEQDLGCGPAFYLSSEQVKYFYDKLKLYNKENLRLNFRPAEMVREEIYPVRIWQREGENAFEYLFKYFQELQEFYKRASENKQAIISFIS